MPSLIYTYYVTIINNNNIVAMQISTRGTELRPVRNPMERGDYTVLRGGT